MKKPHHLLIFRCVSFTVKGILGKFSSNMKLYLFLNCPRFLPKFMYAISLSYFVEIDMSFLDGVGVANYALCSVRRGGGGALDLDAVPPGSFLPDLVSLSAPGLNVLRLDLGRGITVDHVVDVLRQSLTRSHIFIMQCLVTIVNLGEHRKFPAKTVIPFPGYLSQVQQQSSQPDAQGRRGGRPPQAR
jgi:hypothetical protein